MRAGCFTHRLYTRPVAMQFPEDVLHFLNPNLLYGQKLAIVLLGMTERESWLLYLPFVYET